MERRRFIPAPDKMEGRMMMSTMSSMANGMGSMTSAATSNLPITIQDKMTRIDRIPMNLRALDRNRPLPRDLITPIQDAMTETISTLHKASPEAITSFNRVLRDVVSRPSLRAQDARALNNSMTQVLVSAGASTREVDAIVDNLHTLATTVNTTLPEPVFVTTNDYATVLQMTLIVGQPMPAPSLPVLSRTSGTSPSTGLFASNTATPTFAGSYQARATMQIFDADTGEVYGQGPAAKDGRYKITFDKALTAGVSYSMRIRAVDELGHVGVSGRPFTVKYFTGPNRA